MQIGPVHVSPLIFCLLAIPLSDCAREQHPLHINNDAVEQAPKAVSTSLCGDTYLQAFAPTHIAALSWQSRSPLSRATPAQKTLPQLNENIESVLQYSDSFVLFGPGEGFTLSPTLPQSLTLTWPETFQGVYDNARAINQALNVSVDKVDEWYEGVKALEKETLAEQKVSPKILYLTPAGGSAGPNTFVDAVIDLAGGENINTHSGWHSPNLETLLSYTPDLIVQSFTHSDYHSRSNTQTPVLDAHFKDIPRVNIAGKYWPCAGPGLLDATKILKESITLWRDPNDS